jgi:hypothetical protein
MTALAQQSSAPVRNGLWLNFSGGGTHAEPHNGGAFTTGVSLQVRRFFLNVTPLDLTMWAGDTTFRPGSDQSLCGNSPSEQFPDRNNCSNVEGKYAFTTDAVFAVPGAPFITGAGIRYDRETNPWYVVVGFQRTSEEIASWHIKAQIGPDYFSGLIGFAVRVKGF